MVSRVAVSSGEGLSHVGWMAEVAENVLVRAVGSLRTKEVVWAEGGEAGVECGEVGGGSGDDNIGKAFAMCFGFIFAISHGKCGRGRGATTVKEVSGDVGDGGVTWLEESVQHCVAKDKAFSVDGLCGDGDMGIEAIGEGRR